MSAPEFLKQRTKPLPRELKGLEAYRRMQSAHGSNEDGSSTGTLAFWEKDGQPLPFTFIYRNGAHDPRKNFQGFVLPGREDAMLSIKELIAAWPEYLAQLEASA